MKFIYEYKTKENEQRSGEFCAPSRDDVYRELRKQGIKPYKVYLAPGLLNRIQSYGKRTAAILVLGAGCLVLGVVVVGFLIWFAIRYVARRVKEHRMSPIERAWVELDRLLKKGLPGRGRYKDFYVELTMVVRRYVQRKYGIKAPHLTTEEFLREFRDEGRGMRDELRKFLESADMVKFAGVEATPEMADEATDSAKGYLKSDSTAVEGNRQLSKEGAK